MRVALVALPWSTTRMPSPALGLLSAEIKRRLPEIEVDSHFPYLDLTVALGVERYNLISDNAILGEVLYAAQLYPDKLESATAYLRDWIAAQGHREAWEGQGAEEIAATVVREIGRNVRETVDQLAGRYDVVGFTTTFAQLFSSLAVAQRLKERCETTVVLGGMSVAFDSGPSVLQEFPSVDYVVQGEGEERLVGLLDAVRAGRPCAGEGILARDSPAARVELGERTSFQVLKGEVTSLDELPIPDYDDFAERAQQIQMPWTLPVEGSRGCWWDRVARTNDPMNICFFCGLNSSTYREKSIERLVGELDALSERYRILRFQFLDNIIRHKDVDSLADGIAELGKDLRFFYELRANIRPHEIVALWRAGCYKVQIGIEGLSSDYLRRIGKGTSAIQNLRAMKVCYELGIDSGSNLLIKFPGTTPEEIRETARHILDYGIYYQPCNLATFGLYEGSSVSRVPERFGISNIRNSERFGAGLPADVLDRIRLHFLSYDEAGPPQDWSEVEAACETWRQVHQQLLDASIEDGFCTPLPALVYRDGGSFMEITNRVATFHRYRLDQVQRDVYLACMETASARKTVARLGAIHGYRRIERILEMFVDKRLMFMEKGKCLSLAAAPTPQIAARRILRRHHGAARTKAERRPQPAALRVVK